MKELRTVNVGMVAGMVAVGGVEARNLTLAAAWSLVGRRCFAL